MNTNHKNRRMKKTPPQGTGVRWFVIISIIFGQVLFHTWIRTESTHTILRITRAQDITTQKNSYTRALLMERARLLSNDRITRIARTRLNLSTHTSGQTIYLPGKVQ